MEEVKEIIEAHDSDSIGSGTSKQWIDKLESTFNIVLPESYRLYLQEINGFNIFGEEVYSIYETDDDIPSCDLFYINRRNDKLQNGLFEIFSNDLDGVFYLDLSDGSIKLNVKSLLYASSFSEMVKKLLKVE